jgi:hypothetical protein
MKGVKMKRILFCLLAMIVVFGLSRPAKAFPLLELRGQGTSTHGTHNLIYDPDRDITWYDYTRNINTWDSQMAWAGALSVDFGGDIFDDWRLPATVDGPFVYGYDGSTTAGYNITNSEMGHLYYTELGNKGRYATDGTNPQPGWGLNNKGDFISFQGGGMAYWSSTEYAPLNTGVAWAFRLSEGDQSTLNKLASNHYGMAVRSGDVAAAEAVPEPTTVVLLGIGLAGMAAFGVRRRRQHGPQVK